MSISKGKKKKQKKKKSRNDRCSSYQAWLPNLLEVDWFRIIVIVFWFHLIGVFDLCRKIMLTFKYSSNIHNSSYHKCFQNLIYNSFLSMRNSPAHVMPLLEIVRTEKTSPQVILDLMTVGKLIKKVPIVVGNCTGFAVNRTFFPYTQGSLLLLHLGVDLFRIDKVISSFGMPMGPFL